LLVWLWRTWGYVDDLAKTAAVHTDPALVAELWRPLEDDLGPVPAPTGS
jgi:hypothetical protein